MPTNNFKLFDQNKANLLSDTEYLNATQRLNGVQTGVASSQLNNKFAYQVSLVAYAIAQIMNQNGFDASDTLAVSAFVGNLGSSLLQKVVDRASTAEAAAGVLENKYISPATMKAAALLLSGGVMTGTLDMNNNKITNLPTPTSPSEPATKGYVDGFDDIGWVDCGTQTFSLTHSEDSISKVYNNIPDNFSKIKFVVDANLKDFGNSSDDAVLLIQNILFFDCKRYSSYTGKFHIEKIVEYGKIFFFSTSLNTYHVSPVVGGYFGGNDVYKVDYSVIEENKKITSATNTYADGTATIKLTIYAK